MNATLLTPFVNLYDCLRTLIGGCIEGSTSCKTPQIEVAAYFVHRIRMCEANFHVHINTESGDDDTARGFEMRSCGSLYFTIHEGPNTNFGVFRTKKHGDVVFRPDFGGVLWKQDGSGGGFIKIADNGYSLPIDIICGEGGDAYIIMPGKINRSSHLLSDVVIYHFNIDQPTLTQLCMIKNSDNCSLTNKIKMCFDDEQRVCLLVNSQCAIDGNTHNLRVIHSQFIKGVNDPRVFAVIGDVLIIYGVVIDKMSIDIANDSIIYASPPGMTHDNVDFVMHVAGNVLLVVRQLYDTFCIVELHVWKNMRNPTVYTLVSLNRDDGWRDMVIKSVI